MTFAEMRTAVTDYCHLTSADAILRVGKSLNRHYRRVTSLVGLDTARFVTRIVSIPIGVRTVTFPEIEKIDRIVDATTPTAIRTLTQVSMNVQRTTQPGNSAPSTWAFQNADADSATVLLDTVPDVVYSLQADGWSTLTTMVADGDEPVFPESFHDLLVWFVISEELLKKEKDTLADRYQARAEKLLADLRFHLADTHSQDTVQASADRMTLAGGFGGGGGGTAGVTGYVTTEGTPAAGQVALFTDADTITGGPSLLANLINPGIALTGAYPFVHFRDSAQPANAQNVRLVNIGQAFRVQFIDDAEGLQAEVSISRTGAVTSLLIFDRGPGQPPFAVAQPDAGTVTNLDSDKLDGQHGAYYTSAANLTGLLGVNRGGTAVDNTTQTYTPLLSPAVNVTSVTAFPCHFFRVGNIVSVSGQMIIQPSAGPNVFTVLQMTLPITTAFVAQEQLAGTGCAPAGIGCAAALGAISGADRANFMFTTGTDLTALAWLFSFTYQVL
jgi:hypothetical protein